MKTKNIRSTHNAGFTLLEIMIVVALIGLLAAIAIPHGVRARTSSQTNACINNLRQIDAATQQWALEAKKKSTDSLSVDGSDIAPYLRTSPRCPSAGAGATFAASYALLTVADSPTCVIAPGAGNHQLP